MVEGVQRAVRSDRELEAVAAAVVLDRDRERVVERVPEQPDVEAVAVAGRELFRVRGRGGQADDATAAAVARPRRQAGTAIVPRGDFRLLLR